MRIPLLWRGWGGLTSNSNYKKTAVTWVAAAFAYLSR